MAINNLLNRSFTGVNLIVISMVEETEPKDFQHKYFMFFKAIPSVRADNSTGRSYNYKNGITFKMEAEKAFAMSFALGQYSLGKGTQYEEKFGNFTIFADGSKSQYGADSKKSLSINYYVAPKTNKTNISLFTTTDQNKVPFFMTPYEAHAMSKVLDIMANQCVKLELNGPGVIIKKQPVLNNGYNTQAPQVTHVNVVPNQPQQQKLSFFQPQVNNPVPTNKVTDDFANFLGQDDDLPF